MTEITVDPFTEVKVVTPGSGLTSTATYRTQGGRIYAEALLETASSGLPNQRLSWADAGQLAEDIIDGVLLQVADNGSQFSDVLNPKAIVINQVDKEFKVLGGGVTDPGADWSLLTFGIFAPTRTAGGDFLE
jgi:hypothetical protein